MCARHGPGGAAIQVYFVFYSSLFGHTTFDLLKGIVDGFSMLNCVVNKALFFQVALHRKFEPIIYREHDFTNGLTRFRKFSLLIVK